MADAPLFLAQEYSWVYVRIYTAAGSIGDTIPNGWQENLLWTGRMDIPHMYDLDALDTADGGLYPYADGLISSGRNIGIYGNDTQYFGTSFPMQNRMATQKNLSAILSHCPYFTRHVMVSSTMGKVSAVNGMLVYENFRGVRGPAGNSLVIVTAEGFSNAYVFTANTDSSVDGLPSFEAQIQGNGNLVIDAEAGLLMPAVEFPIVSGTVNARARGPLILGITDESDVTEMIGFTTAIVTYSGVVRAVFSRFPELYERTIKFLNRWPLNGRSFFDTNSFLKGVLTGQRLREWGMGDAAPQAAAPITESAGTYHEKSYLSGLAAGRMLGGWPAR